MARPFLHTHWYRNLRLAAATTSQAVGMLLKTQTAPLVTLRSSGMSAAQSGATSQAISVVP